VNVHLQRNWASMGYDITFYERDPFRVLRLTDEPWPKWETASEMEDVKPTLHLSGDALEALLAEAEKVIPASHATERHLNDAVAVRDRLLALIEKGWDQP
jgi:hypothetical protein